VKIVTLIENLVYKKGLVAEHGLSLYVEKGNYKILFDTGQSGLFMQNAHKMGIDIRDIDMVILSHGHYDHTGGLYPFLEINKKAMIYAREAVFIPKYHSGAHFIGTIKNQELLKDRFIPVHNITEICPDVFVFPEIPVQFKEDTHFEGFHIKQRDHLISDDFSDELFIVLKDKDHINILSACSHRGITNICEMATGYFRLPVNIITGGFHMKECSQSQLICVIQYFNRLQPVSVGVCHCTGYEKYADLRKGCNMPVFYNHTGLIIADNLKPWRTEKLTEPNF
jgi:7,8-dihydropterin-6-yl-methyl-4-(beta-D-ribofuranosyl)aminobenzene 5'-phosphate synthase